MDDELELFRKTFRKLAEYLSSENPGYEFKFTEELNLIKPGSPAVYLKVRKNKGKWKIIDSYPRETNKDYLSAYKDMFRFLCRNMAIEFDDYSENENIDCSDKPLSFTNKQSRIRKYIIIPCYETIIEMIMKLGLKGIDIT